MRIGLAQMEVEPGNPRKNTNTILSMISDMKREGVELGVFTEMGVPGYLLGDFWEFDEYIQDYMQWSEAIKEASKGMAVIIGNVYADLTKKQDGSYKFVGKDGRLRKHNAAWVFHNGMYAPRHGALPTYPDGSLVMPEGITFKTLHPDYREFDDDRHHYSMKELMIASGVPLERLLLPFRIPTSEKELKVGVIICEDLWCPDYFYNGKVLSPARMLTENGADLIVSISCSPGGWKKNDARHRRVKWIQQDIQQSLGKDAPMFVYVNNVGQQNNGKSVFFFDGRSAVYDSRGSVLYDMRPYDHKTAIVDIGNDSATIIKEIPGGKGR